MSYKILLFGSSSGTGLTFYFTRLAITLKKAGNEVVVLSSRGEHYPKLRDELDSSGIRRYVSDSLDKASVASIVKGIDETKKIIKREGGFDFICGGGVKDSLKIFIGKKMLKAQPKSFATIGWLPQSKADMILAAISYNLLYDICITLSNFTRNELKKFGVNLKKVLVIPLFAPDLEWFDEAANTNVDLEDYGLQDVTGPVIFYAASHFLHKGFPCYLMAASRVLKKFDATFVVGGKGPLTASLWNLADKLEISRHIVFTGWISHYHLPYLVSKVADICVSTSLVEQLPSFVMECMAARKPIVASRVGGVPEVVIDGVNGYLVPSDDPNKVADRIVDLIGDPDRAKKMGVSGRRIVEANFNMRSSVFKLLHAYGRMKENNAP